MNPIPIVPQSRSVKFSFAQLNESYRVFAILDADSPEALRELRDATGKPFFMALQRPGWVSRVTVTVHRSQQPTGLRTALIAAHQSGEEVLVRDYDTAQIYKGFILSIDTGHRTRIKWSREHFSFEIAIIAEGVFNVENETEITWRNEDGELTPERGYPY